MASRLWSCKFIKAADGNTPNGCMYVFAVCVRVHVVSFCSEYLEDYNTVDSVETVPPSGHICSLRCEHLSRLQRFRQRILFPNYVTATHVMAGARFMIG